jgi:hypothetical protein
MTNHSEKVLYVDLNNDIHFIKKGKTKMKKLAIQVFVFGVFMATHIVPVIACGGGGN